MAKPSWETDAQLPFWNPQQRDMEQMFRELGATDLGGALDAELAQGATPTPIASAQKSRRRTYDNREQTSENGGAYQTTKLGKNSKDYDIRDFGTGVGLGNATADTAALVAAAAAISNNSDGTSSKPGVLHFPRLTLLLNQTINIYGGVSTAMSWKGINGRSKGPDGTEIRWVGAAKGVMFNLQGLNAALFDNIAFNCRSPGENTNLARFAVWGQYNRNDTGGSSDVRFHECSFLNPGYYGAGMVVGDESRSTLHLTGVSGTFQVGEFVLGSPLDSMATVSSVSGSDLGVKEVLGPFGPPGSTITGLTSGATATVSGSTQDPDYTGNHQFSETIWSHCLFTGTEITDPATPALLGWAGVAWFGTANNKNWEFHSPRFDGTRYALDGAGSGYLWVNGAAGGNLGHRGKGAICRTGGIDMFWGTGNFENGDTNYRARTFDLASSGQCFIGPGSYFGAQPDDNVAVISSGRTIMCGTRLGADSGIAKIVAGGSLTMLGCGWRESFSGYQPIYDGSGNTLGGSGDADYSRGTDHNVIALNSVSDCNGNPVALPNIIGSMLSPLHNQLWDNGGIDATLVQKGVLSCSREKVTLTYSQVKAKGGSCILAVAPGNGDSYMRGVAFNLGTVFSGGLLSAVTMSIGTDGNHTLYMAAKDVFTATGVFLFLNPVVCTGGDYIKAFFTFTGATVSALTQGSVTISLLPEIL